MAYLVLDLDETVFVISKDRTNIHPNQIVSDRVCLGKLGTKDVPFHMINPEKLSELIQNACEHHDGIIILTAGYWDKSILIVLEEVLDLSEEASKKFIESRFHSPLTDTQLITASSPEDIRGMDKCIRLNAVIRNSFDQLGKKHFVMFDDNPDHINSFANCPHVVAVLAATDTAENDFYLKAQCALNSCSQKEQGTTITQSGDQRSYLQEIGRNNTSLNQNGLFQLSVKRTAQLEEITDKNGTDLEDHPAKRMR